MLEAVSGFWDVGLGFRVCGLRIIEYGLLDVYEVYRPERVHGEVQRRLKRSRNGPSTPCLYRT